MKFEINKIYKLDNKKIFRVLSYNINNNDIIIKDFSDNKTKVFILTHLIQALHQSRIKEFNNKLYKVINNC